MTWGVAPKTFSRSRGSSRIWRNSSRRRGLDCPLSRSPPAAHAFLNSTHTDAFGENGSGERPTSITSTLQQGIGNMMLR
ncbi:unnamed protein product, partial [Laminaria digitata]